jgi:hypothetical protein
VESIKVHTAMALGNTRIAHSRIANSRIANSRIAHSRKAIPDPMSCSKFDPFLLPAPPNNFLLKKNLKMFEICVQFYKNY